MNRILSLSRRTWAAPVCFALSWSALISVSRSRVAAFMTIAVAMLIPATGALGQIAYRSAASASQSSGGATSITYVGRGSTDTADSGEVFPTLPSHAADDLLICLVESRDNVAHTISGWTEYYTGTLTNHRASIFYKKAGSSESNPTVTHSGGSSIIARCAAFRGVDATTPFDTAAAAQTTSGDDKINTGSLTTVTAGTMLLIAGHIDDNRDEGSGISGWSNAFFSTYDSDDDNAIALYYKGQGTAGAVGPYQVDTSGNANSHGVLIALRPVAAGGGFTISKPTGTATGDVMVASIAVRPSSTTITPPSGSTWTVVQDTAYNSSGGDSHLVTYYRVVTAADASTTSYTWTFSGTHSGTSGGIASFSGVDTASPIVDSAVRTENNSTTTHKAPGINASAGAMLITAHEFESSRTWTPPSGMTEVVDKYSASSSDSGGVSLEMNYKLLAAAITTSDTYSAVAAGDGDEGISHTLALKALAGGGVTSGYVESSPTTCTNDTTVGTIAWTNQGNAISSNDSRASANMPKSTTSNYLKCVGFDFSTVPEGATITGITVDVERNVGDSTSRVMDAYVRMIKAGTISTAYNGATTTTYGTSDLTESHGGTTNLWATSWTRTDVTDANFGVAFAAKNTSSKSSHTANVDYVKIRVDYTMPGMHHIQIEHDGSASTCVAESIKLKACANADCTSTYTGGDVTGVNLSPTSGVTWSPSSSVTISGGVNSAVTIAKSSTGTVTLGITGTPSPAPSNSTVCYNTATSSSGDCSLVFSTNFSFDVSNHVADTAQTVTMTSCNSSFASQTRSVKFWTTYVNPSSGTKSGKIVAGTGNSDCATGYAALSTASGSPTTLSLVFGSGSSPAATFSLCYPDAGQVTLNARYDGSSGTGDSGTVITGSDNFIAKPSYFDIGNIKRTSDNLANPAASDASGARFVAAGDSTVAAPRFTATVTAKSAKGATMPNYGQESTAEGVVLTVSSLVSPSGGATGKLTCGGVDTGCVKTGFSAGALTITDFAWDEVGVIKVVGKVEDGDYLGAGEVGTPTASGNIGRFYPHHFEVTPDTTTPLENRADLCNDGVLLADGVTSCVSAFSYMGETMDLNFTLTAVAANGATTTNYETSATAADNFAKLDPVTATNASSTNSFGIAAVDTAAPTYLTARLDTSANPGGSFSGGSANVSVPVAISRAAAPDGPYAALSLGVAPVDSDGVTADAAALYLDADATAGADHVLVGATAVRFGRLKLFNKYGSEKSNLAMPVQLQYWGGSSWVIGGDDALTGTVLNAAGVALSGYTSTGGTPVLAASNLGTGHISGFTAGTSAGNWNLTLTKPDLVDTKAPTGSVNVAINLGSGTTDQACLIKNDPPTTSPPATTGLNMSYLRSQNGSTYSDGTACPQTYDRDPSAKATFGLYNTPEKRKTVHVRESY